MKFISVLHSSVRGFITNSAIPSAPPSLLCFALLGLVSGCARHYNLSPSPSVDKVQLSISISDELEASPLRVMYRSAICKRVTYDGDGRAATLDGYNSIEVGLSRQKNGSIYKADLFINGGGPCEWRLSNVLFEVSYRVPNRFGENVSSGGGGGVIVIFDRNDPQRRTSGVVKVKGTDLVIIKDYYPWVKESYSGGYIKRAGLAGEARSYLTYEARETRKVYFEPVLHSDYVVSSTEPKKHKIGDFIKFHYPDGATQSDGRTVPDFKKLQEIRLKAEAGK
jgi:hypothetical protein